MSIIINELETHMFIVAHTNVDYEFYVDIATMSYDTAQQYVIDNNDENNDYEIFIVPFNETSPNKYVYAVALRDFDQPDPSFIVATNNEKFAHAIDEQTSNIVDYDHIESIVYEIRVA